MKKNAVFFVMSTLALGSLFGCKGDAANYYTIDVYGDYEGMEHDLETLGYYKTESSVKIGVCYALKEKKANIGGIQVYKDSAGKAYSYRNSLRTAPKGYAYRFKEFKGFYGAERPIDFERIVENCAIFATFDLKPLQYAVTVKDAFKGEYKGYSELLDYNLKVSEVEKLSATLKDFPVHDPAADPEDPHTWRDSYYIDYKPLGWNVYEYDDDGNTVTYPGKDYHDADGKPVSDFLPYNDVTAIDTYLIKGKTDFVAAYDDTVKKQYTVTLNYQLRELVGYESSGKPQYQYSDFVSASSLPASRTVTYGEKFDLTDAAFAVADYKVVGSGKNGAVDRYNGNDPLLPVLLLETYDDGGQSKTRGAAIDTKDIRYDCVVTVLYERDVSYALRFHNDPDNPSDPAQEVSVKEGQTASAPKLVGVPAGYVFTGEWTKTKGSIEAYSLENVHEDVELYPVLIPESITNPSGITFSAYVDGHGYALTDVDDVLANYELTPARLAVTLPEGFPFARVSSFGAAAAKITLLDLPSSVTSLAHGVLGGLVSAATIDLSHTKVTTLDTYSFQNLVSLHEVHLPSTLTSVGVDLFRNCSGLSEVHIDLTEEEVASRQFSTGWASGKTIIYKP